MNMTSHFEPETEFQLLAEAMSTELIGNIIPFWLNQKDLRGGFHSFSNVNNIRNENADKGALLNSRIIWFFSRSAAVLDDKQLVQQCFEAAEHGVNFLKEKLIDPINGGIYWSVDVNGQPLDTQKHIYNQAFAVYALAEWYELSKDTDALAVIENLFLLIEKHGRDSQYRGYLEAFDEQWQPIDNHLVCDTEDVVCEKSMNTHLHIMEAYSRLYDIHPSGELKMALKELVQLMCIETQNERFSFAQFFNRQWQVQSINHSYGHDIEGSWLIWDAAVKVMSDSELSSVKEVVLSMAESVLKYGVDYDGAVCNELINNCELDTTRIWWVQAEGVVGFVNAWQINQEDRFLMAASSTWRIVEGMLVDRDNGGWHQETDRWGNVRSEPKVSFWKCPYHNGRACLEVITRGREE